MTGWIGSAEDATTTNTTFLTVHVTTAVTTAEADAAEHGHDR